MMTSVSEGLGAASKWLVCVCDKAGGSWTVPLHVTKVLSWEIVDDADLNEAVTRACRFGIAAHIFDLSAAEQIVELLVNGALLQMRSPKMQVSAADTAALVDVVNASTARLRKGTIPSGSVA